MEKRDLRSLSKQSQEELRMRAVKLLRQGHSRRVIGGMLEAHRNTIGRWVADRKSGGVKALQIKQRGRKKSPALA